MKISMIALILASGMLFAEGYIQPDRMKNMQEMETAMATIQKGFLYNNKHVVSNGVKDLKARVKYTESFIKKGINKEGINAKTYAKKQAEEIDKLADKLLENFEKGDRYTASNDYLKTLSKCLSCHETIRKW